MKKSGRFLAILILFLGVAVRLNKTAELGTQADEGVVVFAAERVAEGDVLYLDLFENRTPGIVWLLAGVFRVIEANTFYGRWLSVLMTAVTMAGLFLIARMLTTWVNDKDTSLSNASAFLAISLFAFAPLSIFWARYVMLEIFQTMFVVMGIGAAFMGIRKGEARWWLFSGLFASLAVWSKQTSIILLPVFFVYWLVLTVSMNWKRVVRFAFAWGIGFLGILLLLVVILMAQGAWPDFTRFVSGVDRVAVNENLVVKFLTIWEWGRTRPLPIMAVVGASFLLLRRKPVLFLIPIWGMAELAALFLPQELDLGWGGFSHYAIPTIAALSLMAVFYFSGLRVLLGQRSWLNRFLGVACILFFIMTLPGWVSDLKYTIWNSEYPQPNIEDETRVGLAVALATPENQPILVLANAIFYKIAERSQVGRFYHYPSYLPQSPLSAESEAEILNDINNPETGAVLVSRIHLEERLPSAIFGRLWERWQPVAVFPYAYQRDVLLFLPDSLPAENYQLIEAVEFEKGIQLNSLKVNRLDSGKILIGVNWQTDTKLIENYKVFIHILDPDGTLIAQHDGTPSVGFRPTSTWTPGEKVMDWHWIESNQELTDDYTLSIGLYHFETGNRLRLLGKAEGIESFVSTISNFQAGSR